MKKYSFFLINIFLITFCVYAKSVPRDYDDSKQKFIPNEQVEKKAKSEKRKKIIIFKSDGGGGHTSATNALTSYLQDKYEICVINLFKVLGPIDPVKNLTFSKYYCEDFYNYSLKKGWTSLLNTVTPWAASRANILQKQIEELIEESVNKENADLFISVIPLLNGCLSNIAQKHNIPFLIITTDLDSCNYTNGLSNNNKNFYYCLSFDDKEIKRRIKKLNLPKEQIKILGFPVRPEFLEPKEPDLIPELKKTWSMPLNKPIIMILMGAAGSSETYKYFRAICKQPLPLHVIICLGRNENLKHKINRLAVPKHITFSTIGFTDKISELMSMADVLITKPGPTTLCEALYLNIPVILDGIYETLYWEAFNKEFVKKYKLGSIVSNYNDLGKILEKFICKDYKNITKRRIRHLKKENFGKNIIKFVDSLLEKPVI